MFSTYGGRHLAQPLGCPNPIWRSLGSIPGSGFGSGFSFPLMQILGDSDDDSRSWALATHVAELDLISSFWLQSQLGPEPAPAVVDIWGAGQWMRVYSHVF